MEETPTIRTQLVQALARIAPCYDPASSASLVLDSVGLTELLTFLETQWEITIGGAELRRANFGSLDALERLVRRKIAGRA